MKFKDKVAIVTGAGSGMGQAVAVEAAKEGAAVVVADLNEIGIKNTIDQIESINGNALPFQYDAGKIDEAKALVGFTVKELGGVDLLCYSAGIS